MNNWTKIRLGDHINLITDYHANGSYKILKENVTLKSDPDYCIMIRTLNFERNDFKDDLIYLNQKEYEYLRKTKVYSGDIIMNKIANPGSVYVMPEINKPVSLAMNLFLIRFKDSVDQMFMYYMMHLNESYIKRFANGTTTLTITKDSVRGLEFRVPEISLQKKIAKVLADLDAKIELNNKINSELEAMTKLIYDYWFVQFDFPDENGKPYKASGGKMVYNGNLNREIPEGWEVNELGTLGNFKNGVNYDPSNPGEVACPIINVRNISASSYFLKNEDLDIIYLRESDVRKYAVHEGSIIIARSGIPGATRLISDFEKNTLYCGFAIHYKLLNLSQKVPVFFFLKSIEQMIRNGSGGTILKNVNQATLNELKIPLPKNLLLIEEFNKKIDPMFEKINLIQKENQKLAELRDWLLPMLMNGQVKVK